MPKPTITITGYVSKKPEMRYTPKGLAVLSFSIPVKVWSKNEREGYKPAYSGTGFECTAWFNIVMFGESADQANEWLDKGAFVQCDVKPNGYYYEPEGMDIDDENGNFILELEKEYDLSVFGYLILQEEKEPFSDWIHFQDAFTEYSQSQDTTLIFSVKIPKSYFDAFKLFIQQVNGKIL